ncbi:YigZ family protein [Vallitalea longa]|uniref:YigZ family protein n=1 Tax=Vallitalea longa TaxID=2936439 RepID=A0A9W5Y7K5_9FIRM|nr:YigZ family protein [Vallitalea longa]GKX27942.1 YigZ family protein [Vallitalea longa]
MIEKYLTIYDNNEAELEQKKSKFIATIKHVETEEEIKIFLEQIRKKYWNATHNVFAYTIGLKQPIERCSDDGEPSGTAGMPILEVIRGMDLRNVIVIVTRYFGGTLLGTGGLVRAYSGCAKLGLETSVVAENILYYLMDVKVNYTLSGKVQYEILQNNYIIYDTQYQDNVIYTVLVEYGKKDVFKSKIMDITSGCVNINNNGLYYGFGDNEQKNIVKFNESPES